MWKLFAWSAIIMLVAPAAQAAETGTGDVAAARDLYAAADYEGALTILNRLEGPGVTSGDLVLIEQYRALCYLALGDEDKAQQAVEHIVMALPFYRIAGTDISPRLHATFAQVRRRMLPAVAWEKYGTAKAAYDGSKYSLAEAVFREIVVLLDDPDVAEIASGSLSELKHLAAEFVALSVRLNSIAAVTAEPSAIGSPITSTPSRDAKSARIYTADSVNVVAPVVISQNLPPYAGTLRSPLRGALEVTIGENGSVLDARIKVATKSAYDVMVLAVAHRWRYTPASVDGIPVKYRKIVEITVLPSS